MEEDQEGKAGLPGDAPAGRATESISPCRARDPGLQNKSDSCPPNP